MVFLSRSLSAAGWEMGYQQQQGKKVFTLGVVPSHFQEHYKTSLVSLGRAWGCCWHCASLRHDFVFSSSSSPRDCRLQYPISSCGRDCWLHHMPRPEPLQTEHVALPGVEGRDPRAERGADKRSGLRSSSDQRRNSWPHWIWYVGKNGRQSPTEASHFWQSWSRRNGHEVLVCLYQDNLSCHFFGKKHFSWSNCSHSGRSIDLNAFKLTLYKNYVPRLWGQRVPFFMNSKPSLLYQAFKGSKNSGETLLSLVAQWSSQALVFLPAVFPWGSLPLRHWNLQCSHLQNTRLAGYNHQTYSFSSIWSIAIPSETMARPHAGPGCCFKFYTHPKNVTLESAIAEYCPTYELVVAKASQGRNCTQLLLCSRFTLLRNNLLLALPKLQLPPQRNPDPLQGSLSPGD